MQTYMYVYVSVCKLFYLAAWQVEVNVQAKKQEL